MNDCVGALKHDQERLCETAFDQCWHLSLVLYPLHAPLDLKTCSLLEECVSVELLTANPGSQAKPQRKKSVGECCCYLSREAHTTGRMQVHSAQTPARLRRTHTHTHMQLTHRPSFVAARIRSNLPCERDDGKNP